jgi:hypothetical protein
MTEIKELHKKSEFELDKKSEKKYLVFSKLLKELRKKELPEDIIDPINMQIESINSFYGTTKELVKLMKKGQYAILKLLEKELKIVPKNYYRNLWMVLGMSAFGIPLGVAYGSLIGNMGMLGVGLPIGMVVGMAMGSAMDKKAKDSGKQLDLVVDFYG